MSAKTAKLVLEEHWDGKLPVDPFAIAEKMGVKVCADDNIGPCSGTFQREESGPMIRFNPFEPNLRQRFTIAHELGHFALEHGDSFRDTIGQFSAYTYDPKEASANKFAAELLMPKFVVDKFVSHGKTTLSDLAKAFSVSEVAMKFRLSRLGWIS